MWDLHPPLRLRRSRDGHTRLHLACFFLAQEAHVFTEQGEDSPPPPPLALCFRFDRFA